MSDHVVLAQISDLHLPAEGLLFERVDAHERLGRALAAVDRFERPPDVVVLSGDLANDGAPESYAAVAEIVVPAVEAMGAALVAVPGNHDDAGQLRALLGHPLDHVIERGGLRVVALDTSVPDAHHGELSAAQLYWLADVLATPAPDGSALVLHHAPLWSSSPASELLRLRAADQARLAEIVAGSDVRIVLGGHTHRVSAGTLGGVPVWVSASTADYSDVLATDGFRKFTGGGLSRIDFRADGVVATYIPIDDAELLSETPASELT